MYIRENSACLLPFWPPQILGICMVQQTLANLGKVCNIFAQLFGFRECWTAKGTSKCQKLYAATTTNLAARPTQIYTPFDPFAEQLPEQFVRHRLLTLLACLSPGPNRAELAQLAEGQVRQDRAGQVFRATLNCFVGIN